MNRYGLLIKHVQLSHKGHTQYNVNVKSTGKLRTSISYHSRLWPILFLFTYIHYAMLQCS